MKIMKYMIQALIAGGLFTSCLEDADVTAYLTEDQLGSAAQEDPDKTFSAAAAGLDSYPRKLFDADVRHNYLCQ